jgi:hypothetical protein
MSERKYNPDRDVTPAYLSTVRDWIAATGEVLVIMRYLCGGGSKDFALVTSPEEFDQLVDVCPMGTDIIVFRDPQLPLRGVVDDAFVKQVQDLLHDQDEYLFLNMKPEKPNDPRCFGEFDYLINLKSDLEEMEGKTIAIGRCPDFTGPDNESMISASKGGIDGPR